MSLFLMFGIFERDTKQTDIDQTFSHCCSADHKLKANLQSQKRKHMICPELLDVVRAAVEREAQLN